MPDRRAGAGPPVRIAHVAQIRVAGSRVGVRPAAAVETLAADIDAARPTLTVVTGECARPFADDEIDAVRMLLGRLPAPRLVLLGAHATPALRERLSGAAGRSEPGGADAVANAPGVRAVALQSMTGWQCTTGQVPARHATAVRRALADTPPSLARVVALHHRPFLSDSGGRHSLTGALVDSRVDVVLAGSSRVPSVRRTQLWNGAQRYPVVEVVSEGTTPESVRSGQLAWQLIRVDEETITVEQRHLLDGGWRAGRSVRYARGG